MDISTEQSLAVTEWLKQRRKELGLTMQEVAAQTHVGRSRIADLEKSFTDGTRFIDVARIARFYGMDLNEMARRLGI